MLNRVSQMVATLGIIGFLPRAPGTFGSAAGLLVLALVPLGDTPLLIVAAGLFIIGCAASHRAEKILGRDSGHIVIDELCGYLVACLFLPKTAGYLVAAFILFRVFDIAKPFPIRRLEKALSGGVGIMTDDILAAVYANLCIHLWVIIFVQ